VNLAGVLYGQKPIAIAIAVIICSCHFKTVCCFFSGFFSTFMEFCSQSQIQGWICNDRI